MAKSKLKALEWPQHYILIFFQTLKFELFRDVTNVLVTSKNKEDPNKNEGARVATTLNIDFSHS